MCFTDGMFSNISKKVPASKNDEKTLVSKERMCVGNVSDDQRSVSFCAIDVCPLPTLPVSIVKFDAIRIATGL